MYAVGRLGSYITRGVYNVSGPFHPFGGAVDIIVVEQPDGSFKSSPWYVRFGKFQGVLKAKERVVNISVNGIEANFHMHLDQRGEAYFLREVEGEEGESFSSSSSDESGEQFQKSRTPVKFKSCNYDGNKSSLDDQIDASDQKIVTRTNSRKSRIFGLVFGQRSMRQDSYHDGDGVDSADIARRSSLERAEIAANLLDVKWTTNLATSKHKKDNAPRFSASDTSYGEGDKPRVTSDGEIQVDSSMPEAIEHFMLAEVAGSCNVQMGNSSHSAFVNQNISIEEADVEISSSGNSEQIIETYLLDDSALKEISELSKDIDEPSIQKPDHENPEGGICKVRCSDSQVMDMSLAFPCNKFHEDHVSNESNIASPAFGFFEEETVSNSIQSFIYCKKLENSVMGLDGSKEQSEETLYLTSGGPGEVHFCANTLHLTTELLSEGAVGQQAEEIELETVHIESYDYSPRTNPSPYSIGGQDDINLQVPFSDSYTQKVYVDPTLGLVEVEPKNINSVSGFSNSVHPIENEVLMEDKITRNELQPSMESVDLDQLNGDCDLAKAVSAPVSESSEDEQFLFSDFNNFKNIEAQRVSNFVDDTNKDDNPSCSLDGSQKINEPLNANEGFFQENQLSDTDNLIVDSKVATHPISIPKLHAPSGAEVGRLATSLPTSRIDNLDTENGHCPLGHSLDSNFEWRSPRKEETSCINSDTNRGQSSEHSTNENFLFSEAIKSGFANPTVEISLCRHLLYGGMGAEAASRAFDAEKLDIDKLVSLGPVFVKNDRLIVRIGGHYFPWNAAAPIVLGMVTFGSEVIFEPKGLIPVDRVEKSLVGDPSEAIVTTGGSWRLWPFTFRRSRSMKTMQSTPADTGSSDVESVSESNIITDNDKNVVKTKVSKKKVKAKTPTSEELASLNLKEGSNVVTFTFSTAMLGRQKVDARIYLWKWNTRIVISDVDGTITKSDVLGQFMPLVGVDWCQTGVAHLFSAIKENGYHLLFLSARAISQAYHTRQFLVNIKQDGKALPDGPVVISPDGLFPSLFREVIRRAPHEFKIACLEDIKALFPSDYNPFYAGFGNRDTDEFSYLKVGIPKGKIFIINPKGEVAVNRSVDTRSYTSLRDLVHDMFPAMTSSEQEDFNSWNYWKLPPPVINI